MNEKYMQRKYTKYGAKNILVTEKCKENTSKQIICVV